MRRFALMAVTVLVVGTLLVTAASAQGWGCGSGGRWANLSQEDSQEAANLHQKVRQAQWDLWSLQAQKADDKKIGQKRSEVLRLRSDLAKLMTDLGPCPAFQAGTTPPQVGAGVGAGLGRGPCGLGLGLGRGRGGRGMGFGGGCWRWQR